MGSAGARGESCGTFAEVGRGWATAAAKAAGSGSGQWQEKGGGEQEWLSPKTSAGGGAGV